jgi:carbon storage regulator
MLILARKAGESIRIGDDVKVTIVRVGRNEIRLGFEAPREIDIRTAEKGDDDPADAGSADGGKGGR